MPAVMKALGPSRSYSRKTCHHVAEIEQPATGPNCRLRGSTGNFRECTRRSGSRAVRSRGSNVSASRKMSSNPSRNFCGNPRRVCRARQPAICLVMNSRQPGSMRESSPSGARCTSAMVAPIWNSTRSFWSSGQRRPDLRAEHAVQARDDEIGPAVALAVEQDFGDREAQPPAQLRQRGPLRDDTGREASAEKSSGSIHRRDR